MSWEIYTPSQCRRGYEYLEDKKTITKPFICVLIRTGESEAHLNFLIDKEFFHNSSIIISQASMMDSNTVGESNLEILVRQSWSEGLYL